MEARAGRIRHHYLGAHALGDELGQYEADFTGEERAIGDAVGHGVAGSVGHRGRGQLDSVDVAATPRELQADGTRARVEVEDGLVAREIGGVEHEGEEPLGLRGVRLEEGVGRDLELDAAQRLPDVIAATLAFLGLTFSTTLVVRGTRAPSRSTRGASSDTAGEDATTLTMVSPVR